MYLKIYFYFLALFCMVNSVPAFSQSKGIAEIEKALAENHVDEAENILQSYLSQYSKQKNADSLVKYIFYTGKIKKAATGANAAAKEVNALVEKIKTFTSNPSTLRQAYIEAGEFYGGIGMNASGYKANEEALKYTSLLANKNGNLFAMIENNLATYAQRLGNINLSLQHQRKSLNYLSSEPHPDYETFYIACNGIGSLFYYASKTDSSEFYYRKALEMLNHVEQTPKNKFFRPAILMNNLAGIYQLQGKTTKAIEAMESTIHSLRKFLASDEPDSKKVTAFTFQYEATDNLAGIYKELGDLKKAQDLLEYSYQQKQKYLSTDDPAIFISQILLGQLYFATRDYDKSLNFLTSGLQKISTSDGDYLFWQADGCYTSALLYDKKHDVKSAAHFYEKADSLYEESLQGEYDNIYLEFLSNAALFYAENNEPQTAIAKANKGYNYVVKTQGAHTLTAFYQLLNLSQVYYLTGDYKQSLLYSNKSLDVVNNIATTSNNLLDSIRIDLKKPKAVLQKAKATYALMEDKNEANLSAMLDELNHALQLIEKQKTILTDSRDIGILLADNTDLTGFIEKITLELYRITNNPKYLDNLISLHESSIYNRIRSRLDKNDSLQFAGIPAEILQNEKALKYAVANALEDKGTHDEKMQRYLKAIENLTTFREKIRKEYPHYYKMRYTSIFKEAGDIEKYIPANATLVRYFFIDKKLFAFVADSRNKNIFPLDETGLARQISILSEYGMDEAKMSKALYALYQQLWKPLSSHISNHKIIIIPDGILYNLNFEILTPQPIHTFKDLATQSLLARYTISYNYSLFLLNQKNNQPSLKNFVAFAPGFSDKIKNEYRSAAKDSAEMDRNYLSLLPQPFSVRLADKVRKLFGGNAFIHEQSTQSAFRKNAGNHKIIHIGTHAESNNGHPGFSRLIFAKDTADADEDNSLYVDEIYGCNLTSDLTVLTACESGKPGFQDGEGMISLAHAFNYAGSESILTALWKIDEQASATMVEDFYKQLLKGLPKDEALRRAKLNYLQHAEGRMLAPQYWAGLVIMGDTSPVKLEQKNNNWSWLIIIGSLLLLTASGYFFMKRKHKVQG